MNEISNPLDHLIELCEQAADYGTITKFTILNAKDELKRLRKQIEDSKLKNVGWASINRRGDIYHLTTIFNMYENSVNLIPVYCNEKEYKEKYGKLSK